MASGLPELPPEGSQPNLKMKRLKAILRNKWVGFTLASLLYTLWFVVWTGNLWLLLGLVVIYDFYISRLFYRYVWHRNAELCRKSRCYKTIYEWVNAIVFATVVGAASELRIMGTRQIFPSKEAQMFHEKANVRLLAACSLSDARGRLPGCIFL